jgi:hypothetical protein
MNEAREKHEFDVFLSHNSKDKPAVRALAALLIERGLRVWLDEEQLTPGHPWQPLLEKGIKESSAGAVLVGADGLGPWHHEEMQAFLVFAVREGKPVIPVLLPGAPEKVDLPAFLADRTWVDLRAGFGPEGIDKLIWGITGEHPSRKPAPTRTSEPIIAVTRLHHGAEHLVGRETELVRLDTAWHDPKTHVVTIVAWGGVGKTALVVEWMARMARDGWRGAERVFDWSFYSQGTREQGAASADAFIAAALEFFGGEEGKRLAASPASGWDKGAKLAQWVAQRRTLLVLDGLEPLQLPPGPVGGKLKDPALEALLKGLAHQNAGLCIVTTRESVADLAPFRDTVSPEWRLDHLSVEAGADLLFQIGAKRAGNAEIRGDDKELKDAAREVGGHALTLQLLGRYLARVHNGDVRRRSLVAFRKADAKIQGGHAFRTMAAYEKWLSEAGEEGKRQLAVLHLLGLFDRPADAGCIMALRQEPVIDGLTGSLVGLDNDDWNFTLSNLVECGLVSCRESQPKVVDAQSTIDCHPLVHEYFAKRVRDGSRWASMLRKVLHRIFPEVSPASPAWRAAHRRLYEHLCATMPDKCQPTLEDLQPLYQAMAHGCQAGLHEEVCNQLFYRRIRRGQQAFSLKRLRAFATDLGAVRGFFEGQWNCPVKGLSETSRAWLLNEAAFSLRALGRLADAVIPMRNALHLGVQAKDSNVCAIRAFVLSYLELTLGHMSLAFEHAQQGVRFADCADRHPRLTTGEMEQVISVSADLAPDTTSDTINALRIGYHSVRTFLQVVSRARLGDVLHQQGHCEEALALFSSAETLHAEGGCEYQLLHSVPGFRYCDLLLTEAERAAWQVSSNPKHEIRDLRLVEVCRDVEHRAAKTLRWVETAGIDILSVAVDDLTRGRAALYQTLLEGPEIRDLSTPLRTDPQWEIEEAVSGLQRAGQSDYLPRGLLTRAWLRSLKGDATGAQTDIDEAWEIAERGSMRLYMADIYLYRARLFGPRRKEMAYPWGSPQADLAAARKLIEQCGYHRRDGELADAEEAARNWT